MDIMAAQEGVHGVIIHSPEPLRVTGGSGYLRSLVSEQHVPKAEDVLMEEPSHSKTAVDSMGLAVPLSSGLLLVPGNVRADLVLVVGLGLRDVVLRSDLLEVCVLHGLVVVVVNLHGMVVVVIIQSLVAEIGLGYHGKSFSSRCGSKLVPEWQVDKGMQFVGGRV
jgi:hypothetical protein